MLCNCIDQHEIVEWAYAELEKDDKPPYTLIELCLMIDANPVDVERKLSDLATGADQFEAIRRSLGNIWTRIKNGRVVDYDALAQSLEMIPVRHNWDMPLDLRFLNGISDYIYLKTVGGKTENQARNAFLKEFERFHSEPDEGGNPEQR